MFTTIFFPPKLLGLAYPVISMRESVELGSRHNLLGDNPSQEELDKNHKGLPHGGFVIRTGETSEGVKHVIEYSLKLDSNPEFTGSVLVAFARGCYKKFMNKDYGCKTVFDFAPSEISPVSVQDLLKHTL